MSRTVTERLFAAIVTALRKETKGRFQPAALEFVDAAPGYRSEYTRIFGSACRFGAGRTAMLIAPEMLALPMANRDPRLRALIVDEAAERSAQAKRSGVPRIFHFIATELESGQTSAAALARKLGMSERTLHRRLAAQQSSFQEVLETVKKGRAHRLLLNSTLSIEHIAHKCGFQEAGGLYRAFQRWYGCTPAEYRAARRENPDATDTG